MNRSGSTARGLFRLTVFALALLTAGCTTNAVGKQCFLFFVCETSSGYLKRSQARLLDERAQLLSLERQLREEKLKQMQVHNMEMAAILRDEELKALRQKTRELEEETARDAA